MKSLCILGCLMILVSCQKEEFTETETPQESSFLLDNQLTGLIKSVASHDGSFDDVVDRSSCFSINFPYQVQYNDEIININTIQDLAQLNPEASIEPIMPISISLANYEVRTLETLNSFTNLVGQCANGALYNDRIVCVDFSYPIEVSLYDKDARTFETIFFEHDKDTFTSIESFSQNILANINYPITLLDENENTTVISNNSELKQYVLQLIPICE